MCVNFILSRKFLCKWNCFCHVNNLPTKGIRRVWWYVNCFCEHILLNEVKNHFKSLIFSSKRKCTFFTAKFFCISIHILWFSTLLFSTTKFYTTPQSFHCSKSKNENLTRNKKYKRISPIHYFQIKSKFFSFMSFFLF